MPNWPAARFCKGLRAPQDLREARVFSGATFPPNKTWKPFQGLAMNSVVLYIGCTYRPGGREREGERKVKREREREGGPSPQSDSETICVDPRIHM